MERETPPEGTAIHRAGRGDPVTGDLHREHWIVPVHGLNRVDPDGIVQAIARRDGTVSLHLTCGNFRTRVWLDISRAAQLSTGIWEAAGTAQRLTGYLGDDQLPPPQPLPNGSGVQPVARRPHPHDSAPSRCSSPMPRRRLVPVSNGVAMDETRMIGWRIRRIRTARDKSLRVIAGLAGMSRSTLHRIERGQRELTLSEIVALASALETTPSKLIRLAILAPANGSPDATKRAAQALIPGSGSRRLDDVSGVPSTSTLMGHGGAGGG